MPRQGPQFPTFESIEAALTSSAARIIGLAKRDGMPGHVDEACFVLKRAIGDLEEFGALCGCDTGLEDVLDVLKQVLGWCRAHDYEAARKALNELEERRRSR